jgi:hypothetical protein
VTDEGGEDDELVFIDESGVGKGERQRDAADVQPVSGVLLQLLDCFDRVAGERFGISTVRFSRAGHQVLLGRVDRLLERPHPWR